ncbi:MAG: hypothetical protein K6E36_09225 [Oscillospiraceae bacterium]|nr:hypothetical protein [Oscillospiraceae bacterium]MCR5306666.1 hypothetical protein [Oscillospiraceae bacterium]
MDHTDLTGIPFTGFPMKQPEMQIEAPPANPFSAAAEETDFSRDTQTWD